MGRIKNTQKYPFKVTPVGDDYVIVSDSQNNGKSVSVKLSDLVALALGGGGTDTFATLNGNIISFPDGQTIDVTPVIDTDTDTFATLSNTVITLPDGQAIDVTDGNATISGNIITFGDGQTRDITPVVDTDTNTFATFAGGIITFEDGQTVTLPSDDQTATEVLINPISGLMATNVQEALISLLSSIPTNTSSLTNDGDTGVNAYLTENTIPSYTLEIDSNDIVLFRNGVEVSREILPSGGSSITVEDSFTSVSTTNALSAKKGNDIIKGLNRLNIDSRLSTLFDNITHKQISDQSQPDMTGTPFDRNVIIQRIDGVNYMFIEDGILDSAIISNIIQEGNIAYVNISERDSNTPFTEGTVTPSFLFGATVNFTPVTTVGGVPANYKTYVVLDRDGAGSGNSSLDSPDANLCTIQFALLSQAEVSILGDKKKFTYTLDLNDLEFSPFTDETILSGDVGKMLVIHEFSVRYDIANAGNSASGYGRNLMLIYSPRGTGSNDVLFSVDVTLNTGQTPNAVYGHRLDNISPASINEGRLFLSQDSFGTEESLLQGTMVIDIIYSNFEPTV